MNITINSNFNFSVKSIQYTPNGKLQITLTSVENQSDNFYQYIANFGDGQAEEKPAIRLLQYAKDFAESANVKSKTRESYLHMCKHLETYGDTTIDKVTTAYLQDFIQYLQSQNLKTGSV